jgi:hypothetical protein
MASKWVKGIMTVAAMGVLLQTVAKPVAGSPVYTETTTLSVSGPATSTDTETLAVVTPIAVEMVDNAINTLSDGLAGMDENERMLFQRYFDPGNTGDVDERFAEEVFDNYLKIRGRFDSPIQVEVKAESRMCIGRRLYYTDMFKVYVCPAFRGDESQTRRARDLIHEVTHIALKTLDRPYYAPNSRDYSELTPWGSPLTQLPVVGPVISQVLRNDTAYHPDAYAWFASSVKPLQADMDIAIK